MSSTVAQPIDAVQKREKSWWATVRDPLVGLIFILPMLVLFVVFKFIPTIGAAGMSLTDYRLNGDVTFIGLDNYVRLLSDDIFLSSLWASVLYALLYVPMVFLMGLVTALLLHHVARFRGFFRGALFLPYVTSSVLAAILWLWVFASDGLINGLRSQAGLESIGFLSDGQLSVLTSIAIVATWRGFGYPMLILLAGLKNIPEDLTEAAMVDGAGPIRRFFSITLPLLRPVIFFVMVVDTIVAFQVFDLIYVMTGGGPARASHTLVFMLYEQGFQFFDFGYAATIGVAIFMIVLVISLIQRIFLDKDNQ
jgi:multiple sugar transport system permease protein